MGNFGIVWKKIGLLGIVLAALAIVGYAQTTRPQPRAHSANLQSVNDSGYLGVGVRDLNPDEIRALGLKDGSGVKVTIFTPGGPGEKAGIRLNDVILEFNGQKVEDQGSFQDSIVAKTPGTKVNLTVLRGGTTQNIAVVLGTRPPDLPRNIEPNSPSDMMMMAAAAAAAAMGTPAAGFDCEQLTPQLAEFFGVQDGVLVRQVFSRTPEERAGLKAGDIVIKVNGYPVASPREISGIVRQMNKKIVIFTVVRNKKEITLNIEFAWNRSDPFGPDFN